MSIKTTDKIRTKIREANQSCTELAECPACDGDNINISDTNSDLGCIWREIYCGDCECAWTEAYHYHSITNITTPDGGYCEF